MYSNSSQKSWRSSWPPNTSELDTIVGRELLLPFIMNSALEPIWLQAFESIEKTLQTPLSKEQIPILYLLQLYHSTPPMPSVQVAKRNEDDTFVYGFISTLINVGEVVSLSNMIEKKDFIKLMNKAREHKFATSPEPLKIRVGPWQVIKHDRNRYRLHFRQTSIRLP
jgi:hypothetical protein